MYFVFFNDTATTEIYTLSLHDALPILRPPIGKVAESQAMIEAARRVPVQHIEIEARAAARQRDAGAGREQPPAQDRKSTRLNSSHANISYAVFCLKKKSLKSWCQSLPD